MEVNKHLNTDLRMFEFKYSTSFTETMTKELKGLHELFPPFNYTQLPVQDEILEEGHITVIGIASEQAIRIMNGMLSDLTTPLDARTVSFPEQPNA